MLKRILIIESDDALAVAEAKALETAGYTIIRGFNAFDGFKKLYESYPNLIIVDRELSMVEREDTCLRIRQVSDVPIVVIGTEEYAAETLELGADAYMTRPPSLTELVARVNSLLRRRQNDKLYRDNNGLNNGGHLMDNSEDGLGGLTRIEFRLASCLVLNKGRLLSHSQLINEAWGGKVIGLATLHLYIRRLRKKLAIGNIFGVRGCGYFYKETTGLGL
ncbi:MAG TPA: response regulator transcription factor [Dehalococcoidia bacterium]|nr:response regulator transcription factor [Dehalococcoidia bacterium]